MNGPGYQQQVLSLRDSQHAARVHRLAVTCAAGVQCIQRVRNSSFACRRGYCSSFRQNMAAPLVDLPV